MRANPFMQGHGGMPDGRPRFPQRSPSTTASESAIRARVSCCALDVPEPTALVANRPHEINDTDVQIAEEEDEVSQIDRYLKNPHN